MPSPLRWPWPGPPAPLGRRKASWSAAPPASLASADAAAPLQGPFLYAGVDSDASGSIDRLDGLQVGDELTLTLLVRVRQDATQP